jgi:hypothetical protein
MKQKKDTRYSLTNFYNEEELKPDYRYLKTYIKRTGFFIASSKNEKFAVKIYTPELVVLFLSNSIKAENLDNNKTEEINGFDYFKTYIEAYKEGEQYFETEFKVSPNTLYGANAEQYVKNIYSNFFDVQHTQSIKGWGYVKKQYPNILTHNAVKELGYYSGIVNKVEELKKVHLEQFATFNKSDHSLTPPQTETKTNKLKAPVLGLFCGLINKIGIDKKDETESATVYCERICSKFKLPYSDRVRQNYNTNETKKLIQELTEKVLPLIDNEAKILIQKYLDSKQPPKQNLYA